MKIARFEYKGAQQYGIVEGQTLRLATGTPFSGLKPTGETLELAAVRLLSPVVPGKAICIGLNYRDHAVEFGLPIPEKPVFFIKPTTALIGPLDAIESPEMSSQVEYEAELVVVIGFKAKNVSPAAAMNHVLGYTCGNDVTARDLQPKQGQWTVAKAFDTFMPLGPWIETKLDPSSLAISARLNGELRQSSNTSNLIFTVPELISYLSRIMTLEPGDIIMTGTPSGVSPMVPGDRIAVEIAGIGALENSVR
jgi:2-keto-4-pentenoate hydratase/2-oxohepta-3-ene-1,7-dioic acid hydratase in catechol pathway